MPGYKLKDLKYTVVVARSRGFRKGPGRGKALGAAADGFSMIRNFGHNFAVKRNVDKKFDEMHADIKKAMGNHTGILVVVRYQQWETGEPGLNSSELLSIIIGPAASNPPSAIRRWQQMHKLMRGPDEGKVAFEEYRWVTNATPKKEDRKKVEVLKNKE